MAIEIKQVLTLSPEAKKLIFEGIEFSALLGDCRSYGAYPHTTDIFIHQLHHTCKQGQ